MGKKKHDYTGKRNTVLEKIVDRIAEVKKLDRRVVEYIVRYSFKFIADEIKSGEMNPVMIQYFGTFAPKQYILEQKYAAKKQGSQEVVQKLQQKDTN